MGEINQSVVEVSMSHGRCEALEEIHYPALTSRLRPEFPPGQAGQYTHDVDVRDRCADPTMQAERCTSGVGSDTRQLHEFGHGSRKTATAVTDLLGEAMDKWDAP